MVTVAIVGKPNVGKSTLFNRIISDKKSIIDDKPGVTRDRIFAQAEWLTKTFRIIDTGGYSLKELTFQENINFQVNLAIDEANIIIFLTSLQNGIDNDDIYISKLLKKHAKNKKIIFACNKAESSNSIDINKFYTLGFGKPLLISSAHGIGIGDLLDEIVKDKSFKFDNLNKDTNDNLTFCIIGRPNVGKSSLVNAILKENRVIVSEIPGTTIDAIDVNFKYNKKDYTLIDTAGIRKRGKIVDIEKYSLIRSEYAISKSKIILLVLDGSDGVIELDEKIAGMISKSNIPILIIVNKIDLIKKFDDKVERKIINDIHNKLKFISFAPILFISAKNSIRINKIFNYFDEINKQANIKISTSLLNDVIMKSQMMQQAPIFKGNRTIISYATQIKSQIPTFVIFCSNVNSLHFSYARYIENKIRESFGIKYVPIVLYWKDKKSSKGIKIDEN